MGAIGNMTFGIGFKVKANEIFKAQKEIDKLKNKTKGAGDEAGKSSTKFSQFGKTLGIVGGIAGGLVVAGFTAVGVAAWKAGQQSQESFRIIKAGTGATGAELDGLMQSYRNLGSTVPDDLSVVAKVMADVNTGTKATGKSLEDMSGKILSLNTLTGVSTDVMGVGFSRAMGAWGISAENGGEMMDKLFYISQNTGVGVDKLSDQLITFSGPLRQMGFDFDTSTAMLGKWANEGVNTELVAGSLRIALGKMAKDGVKDTRGALDIVIKKIKQAGSAGEATALAMEAFGAKAGPDMADTIREGRFELGSLVTDMQNSKGIIDSTYNDTMTLGDKAGVLKNKIMIALEPLGQKLMDMAEKAFPFIENLFNGMASNLDKAMPYIEKFASTFGDVLDSAITGIGNAIGFFKENLDYVLPVLGVITAGILWGLVPALWASAVAGWAAVAPWLPLIGIVLAVSAIVVGVIYVFKNWGKISDWLGKKWTQFKNWIFGIFKSIGNFIKTYWPYALALITGPIGIVVLLVVKYWDQIKGFTMSVFTAIGDFIGSIWTGISDTIWSVVSGIWEVVSGVWNKISESASSVWDGVASGVTGMWDTIVKGFKTGVNFLVGILNKMIDSINDAVSFDIPGWLGGGHFDLGIPHIPEMSIDGSHANGLDYVPKDGYIAELHKGERVLTAEENRSRPAAARAVTNNNTSTRTEIKPVFKITVNGGSPNVANDVASQVESTFEALLRRYGLA